MTNSEFSRRRLGTAEGNRYEPGNLAALFELGELGVPHPSLRHVCFDVGWQDATLRQGTQSFKRLMAQNGMQSPALISRLEDQVPHLSSYIR
jgi:hypothetical protein